MRQRLIEQGLLLDRRADMIKELKDKNAKLKERLAQYEVVE